MSATVHLDLGYFEKVTKLGFPGAKTDFRRFSDAVCGERERLRTYVYDCLPYLGSPPTPEEVRRFQDRQRFHYALRNQSRFEVRLGRLVHDPRSGQFKQKGVDTLIATDIVHVVSSGQVDAIVIISGDGDLVPAVQEARDAGIWTIVYHRPCNDEQGMPRTKASWDLLRTCDEARIIDSRLIDSTRLSVRRSTREEVHAGQT